MHKIKAILSSDYKIFLLAFSTLKNLFPTLVESEIWPLGGIIRVIGKCFASGPSFEPHGNFDGSFLISPLSFWIKLLRCCLCLLRDVVDIVEDRNIAVGNV